MFKLVILLVLFLTGCNAGATADSITNQVNTNKPLLIYVTESTFTGNLFSYGQAINPNITNGVQAADTLCMADGQCPIGSTCKSMITDEVNRMPNPSIDWVLQPNTFYYNIAKQLIAKTNSNAMFDFPLYNDISPIDDLFTWTGLEPSTPYGPSCNHWYSSNYDDSGMIGSSFVTDAQSLYYEGYTCNNLENLYCVQQQ